MVQQWFVQRRGEKTGPYSSRELRQLVEQGQLHPEDLVWCTELSDWVPAARVRGLFGSGGGKPQPANHSGDTPGSPDLSVISEDIVSQAPSEESAPMPQTEAPNDEPNSVSAAPVRAWRRRPTFEGSPTTFARSREARRRHWFDQWLAFLRGRFGSGFLDATIHLFALCGRYGLLAGAAIIVVDHFVTGPAPSHMTSIVMTLAVACFLLIGHYLSARLLFVMDRWDHRTRAHLASSVVPDGLSLLSLLGAILAIILATVHALSSGFVDLIFYGVALFIWGLFAAIQVLDLEGLGITINPELSPVDELLGLIHLALKMVIRLCAVVFGVLALLGNLHLIVGIILLVTAGPLDGPGPIQDGILAAEPAGPSFGPSVAGWGIGESGLLMLLAASLWPVFSYGIYLIGQLGIALLVAIMSLLNLGGRIPRPASDGGKQEMTEG